MKSIREYKEEIAERYIQNFRDELSFFNKLLILPITDKMKDILKSDKKIDVNNLEDIEDLGFWRKVLGAKLFDKQLFGDLVDKILKFLKEKQEKILQAETDGKLDELLNLVVNGKLDNLEDRIDNHPEAEKKEGEGEKKEGEGEKKEGEGEKKEGEGENKEGEGEKKEGEGENKEGEGEKKEGEGEKKEVDNLKGKYKLSREDFINYFEGERFYQRNIGNCWLLSVIDSLVSFGDYEKLIRSSVSKNENGFTIRLPLGSKEGDKNSEEYSISFSELKKKQSGIHGENLIPVDGKQGIQALVRAYLRRTSKDGNNRSDIDFLNLEGGGGALAFDGLATFPGMKTYWIQRSINQKQQKEDTNGKMDKQFVDQFHNVLESFNPKSDMLVLSVCQEQEINNDRQNQSIENYDKLGHYSKHNHQISVEAVKKTGGILTITVSNPWNSERAYDISFDDLLKSCSNFGLCTKNARTWLQESTISYGKGSRKHAASDQMRNQGDAQDVNQIVEFTREKNEELRKARGDIIVENLGRNKIKVTSYNHTTQVEKKNGKIIIGTGNKTSAIPETQISDTFNKDKDEAYRLYLYGAKIANMIHFIQHNYSMDDNLYLNSDGALQYDRVGPINTDIIGNYGRKEIGIRKNKAKIAFAKYLSKLGYKCEIDLGDNV